MGISYVKRFKMAFMRPHQLFKDIADEKDILQPWLYYLVIFFTYFVITQFLFGILNVIVSFSMSSGEGFAALFSEAFSFIFSIIIGAASAAASPFIDAGITHLGVMFFKGKGKYVDSFKATSYGSLVGLPYSVVGQGIFYFALLGLVVFTPFIDSMDLANIDYTQLGAVIGVVIAIVLVIFVIGIFGGIHTIYSITAGLMEYHGFTRGKAIFAYFFVRLLLFLVMLLLVGGILLLLFFIFSSV